MTTCMLCQRVECENQAWHHTQPESTQNVKFVDQISHVNIKMELSGAYFAFKCAQILSTQLKLLFILMLCNFPAMENQNLEPNMGGK